MILVSALNAPAMIEVPVSPGDLCDRLTILAIKAERFSGEALENVQREMALLHERLEGSGLSIPQDVLLGLSEINRRLWDVEEQLRSHEEQQRFDQSFIDLARSVYQLNDQRSALKRQINLACGSALIEEKNYRTNRPDSATRP